MTRMLSLLVQYADYLGYELTLGDAYRDDRCAYGIKTSLHKKRLAQDYNIGINGHYLKGNKAKVAHNKLHDFWDLLGGSKRLKKDLNHYSLSDGKTRTR